MNLEVLISTMNKKDKNDCNELIKKMNITCSSLIINQSPNFKFDKNNIFGKNKVFTYNEKGLSRSRNRALLMSKGDICLIADENMKYVNNLENIIINAYKKNSDYDIIAFYVENAKAVDNLKEGKVGLLNSMKLCSVQISFRRDKILSSGIIFDENFGAGSCKYNSGEENIFLTDCLKKGLKIYYCPIKIGELIQHDSTWFKGFNKKYFESKGACYKRIFNKFALLINAQFIIRKRNLYKDSISVFDAICSMRRGRKSSSKKVLFIGDFKSNTGPANVNKLIKKALEKRCSFITSNSKLVRLIELPFMILFSDIVCFCSFSKINLIGIKICKIFKKKCVYLMHGFIKNEIRFNSKLTKKDLKIEDLMIKNVDRLICVSNKYKNIISQVYPNKEIDCVFNGIEIYDKVLDKNIVQKNKKFIIISTGGNNLIKNNFKICEAIQSDKKLSSIVKYIIIGVDDNTAFRNYKFVKTYSFLSHDECLSLMKNADLYIQNSFFESFGLSIIEALFEGCDILISSNIGAIDVLNLNDNSIINDNEDEIEIRKKILYKINHNNRDDILKEFDIYINDYRYRSFELLNQLYK